MRVDFRTPFSLRSVPQFAAAVFFVLAAGPAFGQSTTWTGTVDGAWSTPGNWSGGVPGSTVDATIPAGTAHAPTTAGAPAFCRSLTVAAAATLNVAAAAPLEISGALTLNGAIAASATLRFVGAGGFAWSGSGTIAGPVEIAKAGGELALEGSFTVNGVFTLVSGLFSTSYSSGRTLTVNGSTTFAGGTLSHGGAPATLDLNGDVTCAGTTCLYPPHIVCSGNWTGHPAFAPIASGVATFDGAAPQTILGPALFWAFTVSAGSDAAVTGTLACTGAANVHGSLTTTGAATFGSTLTVSAGATFAAGGALDVDGTATIHGAATTGPGVVTFGAGLGGTGTLAGASTYRFDGTTSGTWSGPPVLSGAVEIAKSAGGVSLEGNVTVNGSFTVVSGTFFASSTSGKSLTVNGPTTLAGGTLSHNGVPATLDLNGDVTCAGTTCLYPPHIYCSGNWTGHPAFAPIASGVATFDGSVPQTILGPALFWALTVSAGSSAAVTGTLACTGAANVHGSLTTTGAATFGSTLSVSAGATFATAVALDVDGTATINGAATTGPGVSTFGAGLGGTGTLSGPSTFRFDGTISGTWTGPPTLTGAVEIAKTAGGVGLEGVITVNGPFTIASGELAASSTSGKSLTVNGPTTFSGGTLTHNGVPATLDLNGDVTCAGTTCNYPPHIVCSGNWTGHPAFAPVASGVTTFDGAAPQALLSSSNFFNLTVASGSTLVAGADVVVGAPTVVVAAGATLAATTRRLAFHRPSGATSLAVNGTLSADAGGALACGPQTTLSVNVGGKLRLVGTPDLRAALTAEAAAGYAATINGTIEAVNFVCESMGPNGLVIPLGGTIAPVPYDLRNGRFDNPFSATSCLLDLQRSSPTNVRWTTFEKSNGVVAQNVRCLGGAALTFTNWDGSMADAPFENDPGSRVSWVAPELTQLGLFFAVPGVSKATAVAVFDALYPADVSEVRLERSDAGGPYAAVHQFPTSGPGSYAYVDDPLTALTTYDYKLFVRLHHGVETEIAASSATPFVVPPPANVLEVDPSVGGSGALQAAVTAALAAGGQITALRVHPGNYAPFTLNGAPPSGLLILADGPGVVVGAFGGTSVIENVPAGRPVEVRGIGFGSASSLAEGLIVQNCFGPVLLDEVTAEGGANKAAIRVAACFGGVAISRFYAVGSPGVRVQQSSTVALSAGQVNTLSLASSSYVQDCGLGAVVATNDGTCVRESYAGAPAVLDADSYVSIGTPLVVDFTGAPNSYWALVGGFIVDYVPYPNSAIQMPQILLETAAFLQSEKFADGAGHGQFAAILPPVPGILGIAVTWQAVALDPSPAYRLSNAVTVIPSL